jgi:hypothetical protein
MPVHERLHIDGDVTDLANDEPARGLAGNLGYGDIRGSGDGAYWGLKGLLGTDANVPDLTSTSCATGSGAAGTFTATFTKPAGVSKAEVLVYDSGDAKLVCKGDQTATGTFTNSKLVAATAYKVRLRSVASDGRIGALPAAIDVTTHA